MGGINHVVKNRIFFFFHKQCNAKPSLMKNLEFGWILSFGMLPKVLKYSKCILCEVYTSKWAYLIPSQQRKGSFHKVFHVCSTHCPLMFSTEFSFYFCSLFPFLSTDCFLRWCDFWICGIMLVVQEMNQYWTAVILPELWSIEVICCPHTCGQNTFTWESIYSSLLHLTVLITNNILKSKGGKVLVGLCYFKEQNLTSGWFFSFSVFKSFS